MQEKLKQEIIAVFSILDNIKHCVKSLIKIPRANECELQYDTSIANLLFFVCMLSGHVCFPFQNWTSNRKKTGTFNSISINRDPIQFHICIFIVYVETHGICVSSTRIQICNTITTLTLWSYLIYMYVASCHMPTNTSIQVWLFLANKHQQSNTYSMQLINLVFNEKKSQKPQNYLIVKIAIFEN